MGNAKERNEEHGSQDQGQEHPDHGRSGEGAASALQQLISQSRQHRHQAGEADAGAGGAAQ